VLAAWRHRTNAGRVVYDRPPKPFTERDIERIVNRWSVSEEPEVLFMSDIADRVLYGIARLLRADQVIGWIATRVFNISETTRQVSTGVELSPRITDREEALLAWMSQQAALVSVNYLDESVPAQFARLRSTLSSFLEWVDERMESL
jgi:hypothetical protein